MRKKGTNRGNGYRITKPARVEPYGNSFRIVECGEIELMNAEQAEMEWSKWESDYITPEVQKKYIGKSLTKNAEVYSYDFLTSLPDIVECMEGNIDEARKEDRSIDQRKVATIGFANAASVGTLVESKSGHQSAVVNNRYTGRPIRLTNSGIVHSLGGGNPNANLINARASMIAGELALNAVPVNALRNKATDVRGTYTMAAPMVSQDGRKKSVAVLTVEERSEQLVDIDVYDQVHAISVRKRSEVGQNATASNPQKDSMPSIAPMTYSMADFLEIVKNTHQSLLSDDVLAHFGEKKNPNGTYTKEAIFSKRSVSEAQRKADREPLIQVIERMPTPEGLTERKENEAYKKRHPPTDRRSGMPFRVPKPGF